MLNLVSPVSEILGVGQSSMLLLKHLGVETIKDLLLYFPRDYLDFSVRKNIGALIGEQVVCVEGDIVTIQNIPTKNRSLSITKCVISDGTGELEIAWFNQPYLLQTLKKGMNIVVAGKVEVKFRKFQMTSPFYEVIKDGSSTLNRIVPIYRETEGMNSKWLRTKIESIIGYTTQLEEWLPDEVLVKNDLIQYAQAVKSIHFPEDRKHLGLARRRLAFDEVFLLQLRSLSLRLEWQKMKTGQVLPLKDIRELSAEFVKILPYELTDDQKKVVNEIVKDFSKPFPALRLLEGDVGSGKTVVAALASFLIMKNGGQVAIMAPTEVLARQHFSSLPKLFMQFGLRTELLVGSTTSKEKTELKKELAQGLIDCVIGTHALIQDDVAFSKLAFVVVDEQHRFGVEQRSKLKEKGTPHLLNMTATPIPRTLALALYGDQDLSVIQQMPPGRKTIITRVISPQYRRTANLFIADQIRKGRQIFVICPLVEESEALDVKSATQEYERLKTEVFPEFRIALLHGRMKAAEKDTIMQAFKNQEFDILVSTSVIEVGIDIPNASIIVIEGAERFGLAQLHQFRGRVGRGEYQSYCLLFTSKLDQQNRVRMKAMIDYSSGFDLAEIDLKIRGPGEFFGTRQSGIPDLRMAELSDRVLMEAARESVDWILEKDPKLEYYFRVRSRYEEFLGSKAG